jgi:hypothetical protein
MSPGGTLLAYATPANIKELRDQATVVSMAWKENQNKANKDARRPDSPASGASASIPVGALETLTVQFENTNLIARAIQPRLILVLVGGVPPGHKQQFKMTPEYSGGARYPPDNEQSSEDTSKTKLATSPSNFSTLSKTEKDIKLGVLHVQRKKLDLLTQFIRRDFELKGFVMPEDPQFQ